jgi:ribose transport system ATP-binding protein
MPSVAPSRPHDSSPRGGRETVLEIRGLRKFYGATRALDGATLQVRSGEIHALLGENGAGKSTLVRILAGVEPADSGEIDVFGRSVLGHSPALRAELGVAFIHQDLGLIPQLSVSDNVALAAGYPQRFGFIDRNATRRQAQEVLKRLAIDVDVDQIVGGLPIAEQAAVAIARALSLDAKLIVLDEPTAKLHGDEVRSLFLSLERLRNDGVACVLITHRIEEVLAHCDRVTVMRDGANIATADTDSLTESELIELIVGGTREAPVRVNSRRSSSAAKPVVTLDALVGTGFGPLSWSVGPGEIVALTGLADSGHRAVGDVLYGLGPAISGSMTVGGSAYKPSGPLAAIDAGVSYLPSDRRESGLAMELSSSENLNLNPPGGSLRWLKLKAEREKSSMTLRHFDVRPPDPEREVSTYSGGNQQKVLLARCLEQATNLIILNEPTGAVDIGAKFEIYRILRERCQKEGLAALVVTSDFEEASRLCDRAIVMRFGAVVAEFAEDSLTISNVTEAAFRGQK